MGRQKDNFLKIYYLLVSDYKPRNKHRIMIETGIKSWESVDYIIDLLCEMKIVIKEGKKYQWGTVPLKLYNDKVSALRDYEEI